MKKRAVIILLSAVVIIVAVIVVMSVFEKPVKEKQIRGSIMKTYDELQDARGVCIEDISPPRLGKVLIDGKYYIAENRFNLNPIYKGDNITVLRVITNEKDSVERVFVRKAD